jgi:hypothetical protein
MNKETYSPAIFLRNVLGLDEQLSELQQLRNRVRIAEMRAIGRKRGCVAPLLTENTAPKGVSLTRRD